MFLNAVLLVTLSPVPVKAQTLSWKRQLGTSDYDESHGVATDNLGNVYISGETYTFSSDDIAPQPTGGDAWVAKYNSAGTGSVEAAIGYFRL